MQVAKSIQPDFTEEEARESAMGDWSEDCVRFGAETLNQDRFGYAMFQLVDEWCGGVSSTEMIASWLRMLFGNIVSVKGVFKRLEEIGCMEEELNDMVEFQRSADASAGRAVTKMRASHKSGAGPTNHAASGATAKPAKEKAATRKELQESKAAKDKAAKEKAAKNKAAKEKAAKEKVAKDKAAKIKAAQDKDAKGTRSSSS
eukprot:SAG25_NODE_3552_length_1043_cov_23.381356_3_plen_201_part_01